MNYLYSNQATSLPEDEDPSFSDVDYFTARDLSQEILYPFWDTSEPSLPVNLDGLCIFYRIKVKKNLNNRGFAGFERKDKQLAAVFNKRKSQILIHPANEHYTRWRLARGIGFILCEQFSGKRNDYFSQPKADNDKMLDFLAMHLTMPQQLVTPLLRNKPSDGWTLTANCIIAAEIASKQADYLNLLTRRAAV